MRRKLAFLVAVFCATVVMMAVQKPVFMAYYAVEASGAGFRGWIDVLRHGLTLDLTVAGYVTVLPILVTLLSLWISLPERLWRSVLTTWFVLVAVATAVIFAVDVALYEHWGFRIDSTVLIYLTDPEEAMASVDFWLGVRQTLLAAAYAALMLWAYCRILRIFDGRPVGWRLALPGSLVVVVLAGFDFLAIRGGLGASVANVSKVYFSPVPFLNHAATNPVFSFLSSLGDRADYAGEYPFFDEETRAAKFDALRGNGPAAGPTERVLDTLRPNVVIVILESFARTVMDAEVDGEPVMPNMQRLKREGVWFENFFANSFRTDRGEVAILSGFPAQTRMSIMKLPAKSRLLPGIARTLQQAGYQTDFLYGGDINFTNMRSYFTTTGYQHLTSDTDFSLQERTSSSWGAHDEYTFDRLYEMLESRPADRLWHTGFLTLSSHEPFEVPYNRLKDKRQNSFAYTDHCLGEFIDRLKQLPVWNNLLVICLPDHGSSPTFNVTSPTFYHIPMLWLGGAIKAPAVIHTLMNQSDMPATLLGQLGLPHQDFKYSRNIFSTSYTYPFAYSTFSDGFMFKDSTGVTIFDNAARKPVYNEPAPDGAREEKGMAILQTSYDQLGEN